MDSPPATGMAWSSAEPHRPSGWSASDRKAWPQAPSKVKTGKQPNRKPLVQGNPHITTQVIKDEVTSTKLVTLRNIDRITDYEGTDKYGRYQVAHIGPWQVVIPQRLGLLAGRQVLFYGHGAFIPAGDKRHSCSIGLFGSVRQNYDGESGYLVQARLWSPLQWHEGHVVSPSRFPEVGRKVAALRRQHTSAAEADEAIRNFDFAPVVGVKRWELDPDNLQNRVGHAPGFVFDMSISNHETIPSLFDKDKYHRIEYQESVKLDSHAMCCYFVRKDSKWSGLLQPLPARRDVRMVFPHGRFGVCSHRHEWNNVEKTESFWWNAVGLDNIHEKMAKHGTSLVILGEVIGAKVGRNMHGLGKGRNEFHVSVVYDLDSRTPWNPYRVVEFAKKNQLRHVPILGYKPIRTLADSAEQLQARADASGQQGLVYRSTQLDGRCFKVLSQKSPRQLECRFPLQMQNILKAVDACSASRTRKTPDADLSRVISVSQSQIDELEREQAQTMYATEGKRVLFEKLLQVPEETEEHPEVEKIIREYKTRRQSGGENSSGVQDRCIDSHVQLAVWAISELFKIYSAVEPAKDTDDSKAWAQYSELSGTTMQALQRMPIV